MRKLALILLLSTALITPAAVQAADVTVQLELKSYDGPGAYLAVYVVDADGSYDSTLWVAGRKFRYLGSLRGWVSGFASSGDSLDGISGASVGSGQLLTINATLSDALIDAGYAVVVDTSVEHVADFVAEARVPLESGGGSASGDGFVHQLSVKM